MYKLKIGDTVECMDAMFAAGLTEGKKYPVIKNDSGDSTFVKIIDDTGEFHFYLKNRFKKVKNVTFVTNTNSYMYGYFPEIHDCNNEQTTYMYGEYK